MRMRTKEGNTEGETDELCAAPQERYTKLTQQKSLISRTLLIVSRNLLEVLTDTRDLIAACAAGKEICRVRYK